MDCHKEPPRKNYKSNFIYKFNRELQHEYDFYSPEPVGISVGQKFFWINDIRVDENTFRFIHSFAAYCYKYDKFFSDNLMLKVMHELNLYKDYSHDLFNKPDF